MEQLLAGLRAAAEPTRLRLLALCAQGDLTVTELTQILGQSQPRVSRHLKLMCEAGLLDRFREGAWVFYRLNRASPVAAGMLALLPEADPLLALDNDRLAEIKQARARAADAYFRDNAAAWDSIRSLHVDDAEVERALADIIRPRKAADLLDVGTGTGRILQVLAPLAGQAVGVDASREMLAVASTPMEVAGLRNAMVRQGDMYQLPFGAGAFDVAVIHQVLHYAEDPGRAVAEAARVLRPGGCLVVVDFAPHEVEELRSLHNHRRLGFSDAEVAQWLRAAGLEPGEPARLKGHPLTVILWPAVRPSAAQPVLQAATGVSP